MGGEEILRSVFQDALIVVILVTIFAEGSCLEHQDEQIDTDVENFSFLGIVKLA